MTLDDAIVQIAGDKRISLTLFPASTGYQANISFDGKSWRVETGQEPLTALRKVLGLEPDSAEPPHDQKQSLGVFG